MSRNVVLSRKIETSEAGFRLDKLLSVSYPEFSRNHIQKWIEQGNVTLDGKKVKSKFILKGGEQIEVNATLEPIVEDQPESIPLKVIHEDEEILVINKQAGLVVHPGAGNRSGTLLNGLLNHNEELRLLPRAGIIHRLDKDTSGVMVIAKTEKSYLDLINQMKDREVIKLYQALVIGNISLGKIINLPIDRHPKQRTKQAVIKNGKEAITQYKINKKFNGFTLLDVEIKTGRTHQIRVHLSHDKTPILGDSTYGGKRFFPKGISREARELIIRFNRQALHAISIEFNHPRTKKKVIFKTPIAKDIKDLINSLKKLEG